MAENTTTEQLLASNVPELPPPEARAEPEQTIRSVESIWPRHTCGKSETAVAISCCSFGTALGMLVLYGLCNFRE